MFGDGVSILDLTRLLTAVREKDLVLQVKILDGNWADVSRSTIQDMLRAITTGAVSGSGDIRLRLFAKAAPSSPSVRPAG